MQTLFNHHRNHFRNDVPCAAHHHGVAHTHIFAPCFVFVVQGGVGDCDPAHENGDKFGDRRELAGTPDLHIDTQHRGQFFLRRKFVRHRPARLAADHTHLRLLVYAVDLVDHPIDVKRQFIAQACNVLMELHQTLCPSHCLGFFCHNKTPSFEALQHLGLCFITLQTPQSGL